MKKNYFVYNGGSDLPTGAFRISPSQLSKFLDRTTEWYRENLMGEAPAMGSTAMALGTCVHAAAEMYVDTREVDHESLVNYVNELGDDIDKELVLGTYPGMVDTLVCQYLDDNIPSKAELFLSCKLGDDVYAAGTLDSISSDGTTIVDYKTTSSKTAPTKISRPYWFQQMTYAYIAKRNGYDIKTIRLVYVTAGEVNRYSEKTGKRLKDYPSVVSVIDYHIRGEDLEIIENTLKLVSDSVETWRKSPELRYMLAQDYRLKKDAPVKLFKKQ